MEVDKKGKMKFYLDKKLIYTWTTVGVNFPLHVDTSIYGRGSYVKDVKWVG